MEVGVANSLPKATHFAVFRLYYISNLIFSGMCKVVQISVSNSFFLLSEMFLTDTLTFCTFPLQIKCIQCSMSTSVLITDLFS